MTNKDLWCILLKILFKIWINVRNINSNYFIKHLKCWLLNIYIFLNKIIFSKTKNLLQNLARNFLKMKFFSFSQTLFLIFTGLSPRTILWYLHKMIDNFGRRLLIKLFHQEALQKLHPISKSSWQSFSLVKNISSFIMDVRSLVKNFSSFTMKVFCFIKNFLFQIAKA